MSSKKVGSFDFSNISHSDYLRFDNDYGVARELVDFISTDVTLRRAAVNVFLLNRSGAYDFLVTVLPRYKASVEVNNPSKDEVKGQVEEEKRKDENDEPLVCKPRKKRKPRKPRKQDEIEKSNYDLDVVFNDVDFSDGVDDSVNVSSFEYLSMMLSVHASIAVTQLRSVDEYLQIVNKHCLVRECLQTVFHGSVYLNSIVWSYDNNAFSIKVNEVWYKVSVVGLRQGDEVHKFYVIKRKRRYIVMTEDELSEYVRENVKAVKKGKSTISLNDLQDVEIIVKMSKFTPTFKGPFQARF